MSETILDERFAEAALDARLRWTHPPRHWHLEPDGRGLIVEPLAHTDFWQRTHYGFRADNGHFLGLPIAGDFALSTQVRFHAVHQYDQAGLMIRADADCWVKASVEYEVNSPAQLGVVVTNAGFSDWSLQDLSRGEGEIRLRLCRRGTVLIAEFGAANEEGWKPMRIAHWQAPVDVPLSGGLYACSPKGAGFRAEFKYLRLESI